MVSLSTIMVNEQPASPTPLEMVIGFAVAEELYDLLTMSEQLIVDLKIAGYSQQDIAELLGISQTSISIMFRRIRTKLAQSKLMQIIEIRQHYREITPTVITGNALAEEGFE